MLSNHPASAPVYVAVYLLIRNATRHVAPHNGMVCAVANTYRHNSSTMMAIKQQHQELDAVQPLPLINRKKKQNACCSLELK